MERNNPTRQYENFSVEYLRQRLNVYENLKNKFFKFTLASNAVSISLITVAGLTENEELKNYEAGMAIGSFVVTMVGFVKTMVNFNQSNRIIYAAKAKGAKIEGLLERRIVD